VRILTDDLALSTDWDKLIQFQRTETRASAMMAGKVLLIFLSLPQAVAYHAVQFRIKSVARIGRSGPVAKSKKNGVNRRGFLKGAAASAAAGAAALVAPPLAQGQQAAQQRPSAAPPSAAQLAAETEPLSSDIGVMTVENAGSDFMVDVFKSLGIEYIASNPGSSFRGLQESFITYGGNNPEWLTCMHEESSVALADGYFRVSGKPMIAMAHGTVGLQHAAMNIYNAFVARNPVIIVLGNALDANARRPGVEWNHSVQDCAAMVRDYIKWDDTPISLTHFAESAVRAYKIGMTVPMGPVILVADGDLQEHPAKDRAKLRIPKLTLTSPPAGDSAAVAEMAKLLVGAENPVIIAGRVARSEQGMRLMVELAETLQAPVQGGGRNMPNRHPLAGGGSLANADVVLGLQVEDLWGATHDFRDQQERSYRPLTKPGAKILSISYNDLYMKSNYQDFQRFTEVDMAVAADAEATLPSLIEACKKLITADRRRVFEERGRRIAAANTQALSRARTEATYGWDASPISTTRMSVELWNAVKDKDWALVSGTGSRLWNIDKFHQTTGGGGAAAVGSGLPIAVGAALAHKKFGRLCVGIQNDGDLMYAPGALWTAAHHKIPLLLVMHNNRAYHQEVMHLQRMASRRQRGVENAWIGTTITDPNIDYAQLARSMGLYGAGPITDPKDLAPALRTAVERVERGEPALIDVVTQPR
jgi:thiamine pyrophosphate-dependent acetolactate synthase large subunit-like protein